MNKSTQLKMIVCGVALVSLSAIRAVSAQPACSAQESGGGFNGAGSGAACYIEFDPGPQTKRVDYTGHSFKVIVNVTQTFFLTFRAVTTFDENECPSEGGCRYPDPLETCIQYDGGSCVRYDVAAFKDAGLTQPIPLNEEHNYFSGKIIYRTAWDFPTLVPGSDNPRGLRAEDGASPFFDVTAGVFPTLLSGQDPAVDSSADGFSQYIVVQQTVLPGHSLAGCFAPLNCSDPNNAAANVFKAGQTIPVKVALNPVNSAADLRLTYTDPAGMPHPAEASGRSNIGNMFRATGNRFEFNWSTKGLAPGVYQLTISPGTTSGGLFKPTTILVTLR